jgi:hypothetical protein
MSHSQSEADDILPPKKPAVKARLVEDEAPRKKKKKSKQKPEADKKKLLIIGGAIAGVLLTFGCISLVAYFVFFNGGARTAADSPKIAYLDYISALKAEDAERAWERMDQETQNLLVEEYEQLAKKEPNVEKYKGKTGKALYLAVMAANYKPPSGQTIDPSLMPVVLSQTIDGTVGSVTLKMYQAPNITIPCIQENGRWKLQLQRSRTDPK